jgi:hypothetical protein
MYQQVKGQRNWFLTHLRVPSQSRREEDLLADLYVVQQHDNLLHLIQCVRQASLGVGTSRSKDQFEFCADFVVLP